MRPDELSEKHARRIERIRHGNVQVTQIEADFVASAALAGAAATFKGLMGGGAIIRRREGEKMNEFDVTDFHTAMNWLREKAERGVSKQRYKGLGDESRTVVGNHNGPDRTPPAEGADRGRDCGRSDLYDADER